MVGAGPILVSATLLTRVGAIPLTLVGANPLSIVGASFLTLVGARLVRANHQLHARLLRLITNTVFATM